MSRWPALAPRVRRPSPLVADVALAVLLAAVSLLTVETGRGADEPLHSDFGVSLNSPRGLDPGEPWNVEITVVNPPLALKRGEPRLTIQSSSTGETTTYDSEPTGRPGVYRVRAVFPKAGTYSYWVTGGGNEPTVTIGDAAAPPASPEPRAEQRSGSDSSPVWPIGVALLATLPIALRRRLPVPVLAITLAAALAMFFVFDNFLLPGAVIALYTVAAHVGRPRSITIGLATAFVLALAVGRILSDSGLSNPEDAVAGAAIYGVFAAAWLLGDNLRTRRAYLRGVEERAARLEREREANARRVAAEEQARIARELHDIIAHNVSVMTVQAAAAGDAFEAQPGRAREALQSIELTGREALTELRRLLANVRPDNGAGSFAPQPRLATIEDLVEQVRAAGLPVDLTVEGSAPALPPGVDLSAYRIVQEALTNTLKHSQASRATVLIRYTPDELEIEVVDNGRGGTADEAGGGNGIIGMRERAVLVGGELRVGPAPAGGFAVHARIPLEEPEA